MTAAHFHLGYNEDEAEELVEESIETIPSASDNPTHVAYAGLSPFDIPEGIEAEVAAPGKCTFRFIYPNSEPGEDNLRLASRDKTMFVRLGQNSGKVLEVIALDAAAALRDHKLRLDLSFVQEWQSQLPWNAYHTCRRNTMLVDKLLEAIPSSFRDQLLKAATTPAHQP